MALGGLLAGGRDPPAGLTAPTIAVLETHCAAPGATEFAFTAIGGTLAWDVTQTILADACTQAVEVVIAVVGFVAFSRHGVACLRTGAVIIIPTVYRGATALLEADL